MLKTRIRKYLDATGAPMTKFCAHIGISVAAVNRYLRDDLRLSVETEQRIKDYLKKFGF